MSKITKAYNALPPATKQAIAQAAAKTAAAVVKQARSNANNTRSSRVRNSQTRRTRLGQRIYSPEDYTTTTAIAPVSYATMWGSGAKSMRVKQTEIIGKLNADSKSFWEKLPFTQVGDYSAVTIPINPANPNSFPWLSYIARLYDKYRFHSLKFRYINAVSTAQAGNIAFALDYDTLDAPPDSIIHASQLAKYQIGPTYCPQEFDVPVTNQGNRPWLYTYDVNVDSKTVDLKTYNLGNIYLIIDGVSHGDPTSLGWIAVDYDVELLDKNPIIDDAIFASKTWDSATPAAKLTRSNVDPADTMDVSVNISANTEVDNQYEISMSTDAEPGSKVRTVVVFRVSDELSQVIIDSGTVLHQEFASSMGKGLWAFNVESVVGSDGTILTAHATQCDIKPSVPIAAAYTYA